MNEEEENIEQAKKKKVEKARNLFMCPLMAYILNSRKCHFRYSLKKKKKCSVGT